MFYDEKRESNSEFLFKIFVLYFILTCTLVSPSFSLSLYRLMR